MMSALTEILIYIKSNNILRGCFVCYSPFLTAGKREFLADYALAVAVIIMSFFGSYVFRHIKGMETKPLDKQTEAMSEMIK